MPSRVVSCTRLIASNVRRGLLAERRVSAILRSGRRNPWKDDATDPARIDENVTLGSNLDVHIERIDYGRTLVERLTGELSPRGLEFFRALFLEEEPVNDVTNQFRVSPDVVYAWRNRIIKRPRRIGAELEMNFDRVVRFGEVAHKERGERQNRKAPSMIGISRELVTQLAAWPDLLQTLASCVSPHEARITRPGDDFALVDHAWHLADLEQKAFAVRISRLLEEESPALPDFDGGLEARVGRYHERDLGVALATFAAARAANLARLARVLPEQWARAGTLEGVGPVTLLELVCRMLDHDRSHAADLSELFATMREGRASIAALPALPTLRTLSEMARAAKPFPCAA